MSDSKCIDKKHVGQLLYGLCFAVSILLQCALFHYLAFHSIQVFTFIHDPLRFISFYLPKIAISFAVASLALFFKNKSWTIVFSLILCLWIIAELIYYRVNGILIDAASITIVGNMKGFWDGIFAFVFPGDAIVLLPTLFLAFVFYLIKPSKASSLVGGIVFMCFAVLAHYFGSELIKSSLEKSQWKDNNGQCEVVINPFIERGKSSFWGFTDIDYVKRTSVLHCLVYDSIVLVKMPFVSNEYQMTTQDIEDANILFNSIQVTNPETRLYIILFESLETWAVSPFATPALQSFIDSHENILWAKRVIKQTKAGISGDGQMIVNTGVLPVAEGVTSFQYPTNIFPSLSEQYDDPALILPGDLGTWNQKRMSDAYGINTNYQVRSCLDADTFDVLLSKYKEHPFILTITIASHTPFIDCSQFSPLSFTQEVPELFENYLNCVHYTDSSLSAFLSMVDSDPLLKESTIVITGDHTIFDSTLRQSFDSYCQDIIGSSPLANPYCPLVIYSPNIPKKKIIEEEAYQMDIYPTILNVIGCEDYYFKGFGKNLMGTDSLRTYSQEEAFALSDKLVRSNYFDTYLNTSLIPE